MRNSDEWDADPEFVLEGVKLAVAEKVCALLGPEEGQVDRLIEATQMTDHDARHFLDCCIDAPLSFLVHIAVALNKGFLVWVPARAKDLGPIAAIQKLRDEAHEECEDTHDRDACCARDVYDEVLCILGVEQKPRAEGGKSG